MRVQAARQWATTVDTRRRKVLLIAPSLLLPLPRASEAAKNACDTSFVDADASKTSTYVDAALGFQFDVPPRWTSVDRKGADASFVDVAEDGTTCRSRRADVVVRPVRVKETQELGNMEQITQQLLQAEKERRGDPSQPSPVLVRAQSESETRENGTARLYYDVECQLPGARGGPKRQWTRIVVDNGVLFTVTLAVPENNVQEMSGVAEAMREALRSFRVTK